MAKKGKKQKKGSKPAKKAAKPGARKGGKKPAKKGVSLAPKMVKTGKGPTPGEVGLDLVGMFNSGQLSEIEKKYWSPGIVSIEGMGMSWAGRKAVEAKNSDWMSKHTLLGASAEGPFVGATGFAVKFRMDVEEKATGNRVAMEEVGVYTVRNGKIAVEEFMYGPMQVTPAGGAPTT